MVLAQPHSDYFIDASRFKLTINTCICILCFSDIVITSTSFDDISEGEVANRIKKNINILHYCMFIKIFVCRVCLRQEKTSVNKNRVWYVGLTRPGI